MANQEEDVDYLFDFESFERDQQNKESPEFAGGTTQEENEEVRSVSNAAADENEEVRSVVPSSSESLAAGSSSVSVIGASDPTKEENHEEEIPDPVPESAHEFTENGVEEEVKRNKGKRKMAEEDVEVQRPPVRGRQQGESSNHHDEDTISVRLDFGGMFQTQGSGTYFKFQEGNERKTIHMHRTDTLKKLREQILKQFKSHLAIQIDFAVEVILEAEGDILSFGDCNFSETQDINVILRSPPEVDLTHLSSKKIDLVVDAKSRGKFIIVVDLLEIVRDIKAKIRLVTFIKLEDQRLFFKKKELEDNTQVGLCGLYNNCCIHLVCSGQTLPEPTLEADQMVQINLFYGNLNRPIPSHCFQGTAGSSLNVLKPKILEEVERCLVIKLSSAEGTEGVIVNQFDKSFAECKLSGEATFRVLLKWPACFRPQGGVHSTRSMPLKEIEIVRRGSDNWPEARFKLRIHPEAPVDFIRNICKRISGVGITRQRLYDPGHEHEPQDITFSPARIAQIPRLIELVLHDFPD